MPTSTFYYSNGSPSTSSNVSIDRFSYNSSLNLTGIDVGLGVVSISNGAFSDATGLKAVTFPNTLTLISSQAFISCSNLSNLALPEGLLDLRASAFSYCTSLTGTITIPNSVVSFGIDGESPFGQCTGLTGCIFGNGLVSIPPYALKNCTNIKNITIGSGTSNIDSNSFRTTNVMNYNVNTSNPYYSNDSFGVLFNKNKTTVIQYPFRRSGAYDIPYGVTGIAGAFYESDIERVTIPDSVKSIEANAFLACNRLTSVSMPNFLTDIGGLAFASCGSLASINMPSTLTNIAGEEGVFVGSQNLVRINFLGNAPTLNGVVFEDQNPDLRIYRKKNFVTGWTSTLQGVPVVLISDNVIKKGGTGKLTTEKRYLYIATGTGLTPNINGLRFYKKGLLIYDFANSYYSEDGQYAAWRQRLTPQFHGWIVGSVSSIGTYPPTGPYWIRAYYGVIRDDYVPAGGAYGTLAISEYFR